MPVVNCILARQALSRGSIAEMQTGEGKTFVSALPAFVHALAGNGVHVMTVNDYLAQRDAEGPCGLHRYSQGSVSA